MEVYLEFCLGAVGREVNLGMVEAPASAFHHAWQTEWCSEELFALEYRNAEIHC